MHLISTYGYDSKFGLRCFYSHIKWELWPTFSDMLTNEELNDNAFCFTYLSAYDKYFNA